LGVSVWWRRDSAADEKPWIDFSHLCFGGAGWRSILSNIRKPAEDAAKAASESHLKILSLNQDDISNR